MHGVDPTVKLCSLGLIVTAITVSDMKSPAPRTPQRMASAAALRVNPAFGDYDGNFRVDLGDYGFWPDCVTGPGVGPYADGCEVFDVEPDDDVDLRDVRTFQLAFGERKELPNDSCTSPTNISDGINPFMNVGATTDGPDEPEACNFFDYTHIASDVWFCYQATCTGEAVVSLCGSSDAIDEYDPKLAVYAGCDCPTTSPIACNDDGCGPCPGGQCSGFDSRVTFQAQAGASYLIRVGGFEGSQGDGIVTVRCGAAPCGAGQGTCNFANGTPGCDDVECCNATCTVDPFCCDVEWDQFCADESAGLCTGSFPACGPGAGTCGVANASPGCEDPECCNTVCFADPFCCVDLWDDFCAASARGTACFLACTPNSGQCFLANGTPGCEDETCCQTVCSEDPFCCDGVGDLSGTWDQFCADLAADVCR